MQHPVLLVLVAAERTAAGVIAVCCDLDTGRLTAAVIGDDNGRMLKDVTLKDQLYHVARLRQRQILRHRADRLDDARRSIMQTLNLIREHQFHARIATKDSFKRLLAIYYVGDIYTEHVPDFDGMQYMEVNNATV